MRTANAGRRRRSRHAGGAELRFAMEVRGVFGPTAAMGLTIESWRALRARVAAGLQLVIELLGVFGPTVAMGLQLTIESW